MTGACGLLTLLALFSLLMSPLHGMSKPLLAAVVLAWGCRVTLLQHQRETRMFGFDGDPCLDGVRLPGATLDLHGPWLTLAWQEDGRKRRDTWWVSLTPDERRRLRMAIRGDRHAMSPRLLAP